MEPEEKGLYNNSCIDSDGKISSKISRAPYELSAIIIK
jgi:hypothetical protein